MTGKLSTMEADGGTKVGIGGGGGREIEDQNDNVFHYPDRPFPTSETKLIIRT